MTQRHRDSSVALETYLRKVVRRIRSAFPQTRRIILFGSHVYGKPTKDSDMDLLVIMPSRRRWSERARALHELFPDRPVPMDFIVRTPAEIKERLSSYFCPFTREILQKGRVVYAASRRS